MNDTEKIINEAMSILNLKSKRKLCKVLNISHTLLYKHINDNIMGLKTLRSIINNKDLKDLNISTAYILKDK